MRVLNIPWLSKRVATLHATLTQFPTIKKVITVSKDGSCFDDLIGCG